MAVKSLAYAELGRGHAQAARDIGHAVANDLEALRFRHGCIVDTSVAYGVVGAAAGGMRSCDMAVYHAIYTRDYRQKHDWQLASYRNTAACARGEVASQVVV